MRYIKVFILVIILFSISVSAQIKKEEVESKKEKSLLESLRFKKTEKADVTEIKDRQRQLLQAGLEGKINPDEYILGPGDHLVITVWGEYEESIPVEVYPTGDIIIPMVGILELSGKTLKDGIELITIKINNIYSNARISVSLMMPRIFKIYVTGEVIIPGPYEVYPVSRVSDAVELAGGLSKSAKKENIEVKRKNGSNVIFNYTQFINTGDLSMNPYLHDGDVICVNKIDFSEGFVYIEGNLEYQGFYEYIKDETLFDLIKRIGLDINSTNWEKCRILRHHTEDGEQVINLNIFDIMQNKEQIKILNGDRIVFPEILEQVFVRGAVQNPGPFLYRGNFVARDYASAAGITVDAAAVSKIKVFRKRTGEYVKGEDARVEKGDIVVVPERAIRKWQGIISILSSVASLVIAAKAVGIIK